ncbi:MAG TPA: DUF3362 domain-containing protein, partial [Oscillospiraceae bacterium]|nr:DUF3362 domain-containing protein [Oscillospiraceae bacterium]
PRTMEEVYVPKSPHEKAMQRALIQYRNPKNYKLVYEALEQAGRLDLVGYDSKCLIKPRQGDARAIKIAQEAKKQARPKPNSAKRARMKQQRKQKTKTRKD